jgi:hypothetical protein
LLPDLNNMLHLKSTLPSHISLLATPPPSPARCALGKYIQSNRRLKIPYI